jgi:Family of unknown function (DUF5681)
VNVTNHGKHKSITKLDVAIQQLVNKAANGDGQALKLITQLIRGTNDEWPAPREPITVIITEDEEKV